jgi:hypothetical protein
VIPSNRVMGAIARSGDEGSERETASVIPHESSLVPRSAYFRQPAFVN